MDRRLWKENRVPFFVMVFLFILFTLIVFFSSEQIYQGQLNLSIEKVQNSLIDAQEVTQIYFTDIEQDLLFLRKLAEMQKYIDSGLHRAALKSKIQNILYDFANIYRQYYTVRIIDSSGRECIKIARTTQGKTIIVPDSQLQDKSFRYYFQDISRFKREKLYISPIDLHFEKGKADPLHVPVIRLALPLFNANKKFIGILILNKQVFTYLKLLPKNIFVQSKAGQFIYLSPEDNSLKYLEPMVNLTKDEGKLAVSKYKNVYYKSVAFPFGKKIFVGLYYDKLPLLMVFWKLVVIAIGLFALGFCLFLIVGYNFVAKYKRTIDMQKAIIYALAVLAAKRDKVTGDHLERTRQYAMLLAAELKKTKKYKNIITDEFFDDLYNAAPLHDIGKVGVEDAVLLKPGKLDDSEFMHIRQHVKISEDLLQDVIDKFQLGDSFLVMAKNICAYHHEQYDGNGYMHKLKGDEIPLEARIFAVCDVYDVIRSERPYKRSLSHEEAIKRIVEGKGTYFDPDVVEVFLKCEQEFLQLANKYKEVKE